MKEQVLGVNKGLYVLSYESAEDAALPPTAEISVELESIADISLVLEPGADRPILRPGSCLVVRAVKSGQVRMKMMPARQGGSVAGTLKLQLLSANKDAERSATPTTQMPRELDLSTLRMRGHLSVLGDVLVEANQWLGGPVTPSRIEGFAIDWPSQPDDIEILYAAKVGGSSPAMTDLVKRGSFAGTRGRALPLVGAVIQLSGRGSSRYQLCVEAIFLGCATTRVTGEKVELGGQTGQEPLVGIRLGVEDRAGVSDSARTKAARKTTQPKPEGRVKVFRGTAPRKPKRTAS